MHCRPIGFRHFEKADLVVEAVFENIDVKHKVIKEIEKYTPAGCIIATNTSAIPIGDVCLFNDLVRRSLFPYVIRFRLNLFFASSLSSPSHLWSDVLLEFIETRF